MYKSKLLKSFVTLCSVSVLSTVFVPTTAVFAAENNDEATSIILTEKESDGFVKNDLYLQFEAELAELQESKDNSVSTYSLKSSTDSEVTKAELFELVEKYEGAEVSVMATGVSHKFVNGGVNSFGTTKAAMRTLASTYANNANIVVAGGTLAGLPLGVFGALIGAFSSSALAGKFTNASNIMSRWVSSKSTKGGVRLTLTETFAISSAGSTAKATIK